MSRKLFAFLLSELKTIRLICQNKACESVTELTIERLAAPLYKCPMCAFPLTMNKSDGGTGSPLADLATAILAVQGMKRLAEVEFILPDPGEPAGPKQTGLK